MKFKIGDGSTGIHWRKEDGRFFLDFRLTPRKNEIGTDASHETADPDLSIELGNTQAIGVLIWCLSEVLQRMKPKDPVAEEGDDLR